VEKHIAESQFLSSRSTEAGVLTKIMRQVRFDVCGFPHPPFPVFCVKRFLRCCEQMSTIVAESAAQAREVRTLVGKCPFS